MAGRHARHRTFLPTFHLLFPIAPQLAASAPRLPAGVLLPLLLPRHFHFTSGPRSKPPNSGPNRRPPNVENPKDTPSKYGAISGDPLKHHGEAVNPAEVSRPEQVPRSTYQRWTSELEYLEDPRTHIRNDDGSLDDLMDETYLIGQHPPSAALSPKELAWIPNFDPWAVSQVRIPESIFPFKSPDRSPHGMDTRNMAATIAAALAEYHEECSFIFEHYTPKNAPEIRVRRVYSLFSRLYSLSLQNDKFYPVSSLRTGNITKIMGYLKRIQMDENLRYVTQVVHIWHIRLGRNLNTFMLDSLLWVAGRNGYFNVVMSLWDVVKETAERKANQSGSIIKLSPFTTNIVLNAVTVGSGAEGVMAWLTAERVWWDRLSSTFGHHKEKQEMFSHLPFPWPSAWFPPDLVTLSTLVSGYTRARLTHQAYSLFNTLFTPVGGIFKLSTKSQNGEIRPLIQHIYSTLAMGEFSRGNVRTATRILREALPKAHPEYPGQIFTPTRFAYESAIMYHISRYPSLSKGLEIARQWFDESLQQGYTPNGATWAALATAYARAGEFGKVRDVLKAADGDVRAWAWDAILNEYLRRGFWEGAEAMYEARLKVYVESQNGTQEGVHHSGEASSQNPSTQATPLEDEPHEVTDDESFDKSNRAVPLVDLPPPTVFTYGQLLANAISHRRFTRFSQYLRDMQLCGIEPNLKIYTVLSHAHALLGEPDAALAIIREMRVRGIRPNVVAWHNVVKAFATVGDMRGAVACMSEMRDFDNVEPTSWVYNQLLNGYANLGDVAAFRDVLDEMKENGIEGDPITYNILAKFQISRGAVAEATQLITDTFSNSPLKARHSHQDQWFPQTPVPDDVLQIYAPEEIASAISSQKLMAHATPLTEGGKGVHGRTRQGLWSAEEQEIVHELEEEFFGGESTMEGSDHTQGDRGRFDVEQQPSFQLPPMYSSSSLALPKYRTGPSQSAGSYAPLEVDGWDIQLRGARSLPVERERAAFVPTMDTGRSRQITDAHPSAATGSPEALQSLKYATPVTYVELIDLMCRQTVPDLAGARGFLRILLERFPGALAMPALTKYLAHLSRWTDPEKVVEEFETFTGTGKGALSDAGPSPNIPIPPARNLIPARAPHLDIVVRSLTSHPDNFSSPTGKLATATVSAHSAPSRIDIAKRIAFASPASDVRVFNHLIRAYMRLGDMEGVEEVRQEMRNKGVSENILTATVLMQGGMERAARGAKTSSS